MRNQKLKNRINTFVSEATWENTNHLINGNIYFTENPIKPDYENKYFFCYHNTHKVVLNFKTQREIDEFLKEFNF